MLVLAGCYVQNPDVREPRYFQLEFIAAGAGAPVPVQVVDLTETITGAEIDVRNPPIGALDETFLARVPGRANAILVGWVGGTCDERADLELSPGVGRSTFTLKLLHLADGCRLDGRPRRLIVTFDRPVDPTAFRLDIVQ